MKNATILPAFAKIKIVPAAGFLRKKAGDFNVGAASLDKNKWCSRRDAAAPPLFR
jgi:hypothetical protein